MGKTKKVWHKATNIYRKAAPLASKIWNKTHDATRWAAAHGVPFANRVSGAMNRWEEYWRKTKGSLATARALGGEVKDLVTGHTDVKSSAHRLVKHLGNIRNTLQGKETQRHLSHPAITERGLPNPQQQSSLQNESSLEMPTKRRRTIAIE